MLKYVLDVTRNWIIKIYNVKTLCLVDIIFPHTLQMIDKYVEDLSPDQLDVIEWIYLNCRSPMAFSK
jgi:hypothetical protein